MDNENRNNIQGQPGELDFESFTNNHVSNKNTASAAAKSIDTRLNEMNKKLPSWNLEPPYTFLK